MTRRVSGVFTTLLTLVLMLTVTPLAFGQAGPPPYPPGAQAAECAREQVPPGGTQNCRASGFAPGSEVSVEARGNRSGGQAGWVYSTSVTADADGNATVSIPIPEDAEGPAEVTFTGFDDEGNVVRVASAGFIVNPALARGQGEGRNQAPGLAASGSDFTTGAAIALVVLLLGAGMLVKTRRSNGEKVDEDTPAEV